MIHLLTISKLFPSQVVQKYKFCQLCVLQENLNVCNCYLIADFNAFDGGNQQFLKFDVPPKFRIDCIIFVLCVKAKVLLSAKNSKGRWYYQGKTRGIYFGNSIILTSHQYKKVFHFFLHTVQQKDFCFYYTIPVSVIHNTWNN